MLSHRRYKRRRCDTCCVCCVLFFFLFAVNLLEHRIAGCSFFVIWCRAEEGGKSWCGKLRLRSCLKRLSAFKSFSTHAVQRKIRIEARADLRNVIGLAYRRRENSHKIPQIFLLKLEMNCTEYTGGEQQHLFKSLKLHIFALIFKWKCLIELLNTMYTWIVIVFTLFHQQNFFLKMYLMWFVVTIFTFSIKLSI